MDLMHGHVVIDGQFVSQKISRIVEAIRDYSPELEVKWVPPLDRSPDQAAFAIIHNPPGGNSYVIFHVKTEDEFDERVLQRIIHNDGRSGHASRSEFEAWEQAQMLLKKQEYLDRMEEAQDIAKHVFQSHKNTYVVDKDLVIKEGIPFNAKRVK